MPKRHALSLNRPRLYPARKMISLGADRARDEDDEDDGPGMAPPFRIFGCLQRSDDSKSGAPGALDIYISTDIRDAAAYDELCHVLRQAG